MLSRELEEKLIGWSKSDDLKPLILRGARQVGKSHLVETFGEQYFDNTISINFELQPEYKISFETLDPVNICRSIGIISDSVITPGKTLLFLDEIQDCPQAIQALRYFREKMPNLHVIGAGSLLELLLKNADFRMPVGRVQYLYLYPLSFSEYLKNRNASVFDAIQTATLENPLTEDIHHVLLKYLKEYFLVGGMPEAVMNFLNKDQISPIAPIHASIIETYESDFGHYAKASSLDYVQTCFHKIPLMVGQQVKYNKIDPDSRSRDLKMALQVLEDAALFSRIYATSAKGLPLHAGVNDKKFKMNFVDVGLLGRVNRLDLELLATTDIMLLNKGAVAEQFVGQELQAYSESYEKSRLYFWARDGSGVAEVDYLFAYGSEIIPIEVKSGKLGKMRSMQLFMQERDSVIGIRTSQNPLSYEQNILTIPLYMLSQTSRLVGSCIN